MRILITGAAGFIGYHLAASLNQSGHSLVLVDNLQRGRMDSEFKELINHPNVTYHEADLTESGVYDAVGDGVEQVYHLAAINGTENFYNIPDQVLRVNVLSTLNLLEWARDRSVKILFSSTSETYAGTIRLMDGLIPTAEDVPLCIDDIQNVRWSYGASKILAEAAFYSYARVSPIQFSIVRYHNIYGPRMGFEHVMPQFLERILTAQLPLEVFGGIETRAFCYVSDAVAATRFVMDSPKTDGEVLHIGNSTEEVAIRDLATLMLEMCGEDTTLRIKEAPAGSVNRRCPDVNKLKDLGYESQVSLREGLETMIPWDRGHFEHAGAQT